MFITLSGCFNNAAITNKPSGEQGILATMKQSEVEERKDQRFEINKKL